MARVERLYNEQAVAQRTDGSEGKRKRVAAYCRVSTDNEGQMSSLELQMAAFRTQIELRPDWELVDIYSDEGISGTRVEKRGGQNRLHHHEEHIAFRPQYAGMPAAYPLSAEPWRTAAL